MDQPGQMRRLPAEQVRIHSLFLCRIFLLVVSLWVRHSSSLEGGLIWPLPLLDFLLLFLSLLFPLSSSLAGEVGGLFCFAILQELLPNRILLITIHNPLYPITVDVLHQVFSPHGFVEKIVTFQKSAGQLLFCHHYLLFSLLLLWPFFLQLT